MSDRGMSQDSLLVSEDTSEMSTISVSEEIKKFQTEINKASIDNVTFPNWKQKRSVGKRFSTSEESLVKSGCDKDPDKPTVGHFVLQENTKNKNAPKRVSYATNEVTVFGLHEDLTTGLSVKQVPEGGFNRSLEKARQIQPSSHIAPAEPPTAGRDDLNNTTDNGVHHIQYGIDDKSDDEDVEVPVLPSVKQLANRFQVMKASQLQPLMSTKKEPVAKVPAMLKVKQPSVNYSQVHSITARSVSAQFRESLKAGKPELTDTIFKLPADKQRSVGNLDTVRNNNNVKANVIYTSSSPHNLYPNGEYIRTSSPSYSGIPAMPAVIGRRREEEPGYSSEDSCTDRDGRMRW